MEKGKNKTLSTGILLTSLYDQYENTIWAGARHQVSLHGGQLLCFAGSELEESDLAPRADTAFVDLICQENVDALLVLAGSVGTQIGTQKLAMFLQRYSDIPVVCVGLDVPGFTSIVIDNAVGMYNLVSHLIEVHHCKRIAFMKGPEQHDEAEARYNGFISGLHDHAMEVDPALVCPGNFEIDSGPNAVRLLLDERKVTFDALVCIDDLTAMNTIGPLRERGFQIPDDIKVAGFDDIEHSQSSSPPLTTVHQPLFEIGRAGVKIIEKIMQGGSVLPVTVFPTHVMIRESCGCSSHEIFKSLTPRVKETEDKEVYYDTIAKSVLTKLEETYGFDFTLSEADDLSNKLRNLLMIIIEAATNTTHIEIMCDTLEDLVTSFFDKGMTVSLWQGILSCIFEELTRLSSFKGEQPALSALWSKALLALFQVESYLQSQKRINMTLEAESVQYVGDLLITSFNLNEIKKILNDKLPVVTIRETFFSFYERDRRQACLIYAKQDGPKTLVERVVFPARELIPDGIPRIPNASYCIIPLESENQEFGFVVFRTTDTHGVKYNTLADKIAGAVNGARLVEKIKQQNIALRKGEEDLRITLNSIGDAVVATDARGNITRMNPIAEELTGWQSFKAMGKPFLQILTVISDSSRDDIEKVIKKIIETGKPVKVPGHIFLTARDNTERRINYSGAPIRSADGPTVGVVLVFRDVTEQFVMEEQLRQTQKMDAIGQLAGGFAHDFNNMLAGIMGYAELIVMKAGVNAKLKKYGEIILNSAENAADLTQKLLAFSRKVKMQTTPVDVHTCIKDAIQILKHSIDRRIIIRKDMQAAVATTYGDPSQIQNAILNLALNARDAMPEGGELTFATTDVTLDQEFSEASTFDIQPGPFIEISIRDTGIGMTREVQGRIFDPFFTTKDVGKGTGLGLAAVYGIVSEHHGAVHVYSELNKGTVFKVYLPVDEAVTVAEKNKEEAIYNGSGCVLVIDDERVVRNVMENQLQDMGYSVLLACDGVEGVELFQKKHETIDLVILDMVMPGMSGRDAFNAIKSIDPDAKILLLSGFSRDSHMEDLMKQGALGFIQKPFRRAKLSKVLAKEIKKT